jgi:hypothetical protein
VRRLTAVLAVISLFSLGGFRGASPANASGGDCLGHVDDPHFSVGANGVIAKGRYTCNPSPGVDILDVFLQLYVCPTTPEHTEGYVSLHCRLADFADYTIYSPGNVTRYVPTPPNGARGAGYWIACTSWTADGHVHPAEFSDHSFFGCYK